MGTKVNLDLMRQIEAAAVTVTGVNLAAFGEPGGKTFTPELVPQGETSFQQAVVEAARQRGWVVASFRRVRVQRKDGSVYYETPAGADGTGWPDLVLMRDRILYRELKTNKGTLRKEQRAWADRITWAGGDWAVWRPRDFKHILKELK